MNFDILSVTFVLQPPALRSSHAFGHRLPAIFLLVFVMPWLLSGCGGGGSSTGYADRPPSDRVAYTAWQEWTRFGRSTVVYGGQVNGYVNRSGVSERSGRSPARSATTGEAAAIPTGTGATRAGRGRARSSPGP